MTKIKIGIDLDNTIINYNESFKKYLKDHKIYLKKINKEEIKVLSNNHSKIKNWTEVQEEIYGNYIKFAKLFTHFKDFEKFAIKKKIQLFIISHKTKHSQFSKKYNLHKQSNIWLKRNINKKKYKIVYTNTINEKIKKIIQIKPDYFVDDLIKIFKDKNFPKNITKIYFSQNKNKTTLSFDNWKQIKNYIIENETF